MNRNWSRLALLLAAWSPAAGRAQTAEAFTRCHNLQSTVVIVDCLGKLYQEADKRLNVAYQKALKNEEPSGVAALRASERAWLEYRDKRCAYLTAGDGTIMRIIGADCTATMTKARADELERDSQGLAGPG